MADEIAITSLPGVRPDNMSLERDGAKYTCKWGIPSAATGAWRSDRWQSINQFWTVCINAVSTLDQWIHLGNEHREGSTSHTSDTLTLNRNAYYPCSWRKPIYISCLVRPWNCVGDMAGGGYVSIWFENPNPPKVADFEMNSDALPKFKTTIKAGDETKERERYDTVWWVMCRDNIPGSPYNSGSFKYLESSNLKWYNESTTVWENASGTRSTTQKEIKIEATNDLVRSMQEGQWVEFQVCAYSRGMAGDSGTVTRTYKYSYPKRPTIKSATVSTLEDNGIITVVFDKFESWKEGDSIKLQRIKTKQSDASKVPSASSSWTDVMSVDYITTGLTDDVVNAYPSEGEAYDHDMYVYYRVGFLGKNGWFEAWSPAFRCDGLTRRSVTGSDDLVYIDSVQLGEDAESLKVVLGWNDLNPDFSPNDGDGTEVSWSTHQDAWRSTAQPSTYDVPNSWKNSEETSEDTSEETQEEPSRYDNVAELTIRDVSEENKYYVRARRYKDPPDGGSGSRTFGKYAYPPSTQYPIAPKDKPENVTLHAPAAIVRGSDVYLYWTFSGTSEQTKWIVYDGDKTHVLDSAEDAMGSCVISGESIDESLNEATFLVSITTGADWVDSGIVTVSIQDSPDVEFIGTDKIIAQPASLMAKADAANIDVLVTISSTGMASVGPTQKVDQLAGDIVWTDRVAPTWVPRTVDVSEDTEETETETSYVAQVDLPSGLNLHNGGIYRVTAIGVDRDTGLRSDEFVFEFSVDYAHTAKAPSVYSKCEADADKKYVTITPVASEGTLSTDVCDVYRCNPDGIELLASGLSFGDKVVDRYAPFSKNGGLYYRLATRTIDGDTDWVDIPYNIRGYQIRFDWSKNKSFEIKANLSMTDKYDKGFESSVYLDGSKVGEWDNSVDRTGSFKTDLVRLTTREEIDLVRELAQYTGPVYVRQHNGCAFPANVEVSQIQEQHTSLVLNVSFDVQRINDEITFAAVENDIIRTEEEDPEVGLLVRNIPVHWSSQKLAEGTHYAVPDEDFFFEFDEIISYSLMTAVDDYAGWSGTMAQIELSYDSTTKSFVIDSISSTAETYMDEAALISGNMFVLGVKYKLTEMVPND